jgi:hypothetical protein
MIGVQIFSSSFCLCSNSSFSANYTTYAQFISNENYQQQAAGQQTDYLQSPLGSILRTMQQYVIFNTARRTAIINSAIFCVMSWLQNMSAGLSLNEGFYF